jgi:hypothetical protein
VAALGLGLSTAGMWLLSERMGINYLLAPVVCTIVVLIAG